MKRPILSYLGILFSFLLMNNLLSQSVELSLDADKDCQQSTYCVDILIKAANGSSAFQLGSSSMLLNYNPEALTFKSYLPAFFDKNSSCGSSAPWREQRYDATSHTGAFSLVLSLEEVQTSCPELSGFLSLPIGTICFDVLQQGGNPNIQFDLDHTHFNLALVGDDGTLFAPVSSAEVISAADVLACDCPGAGIACDDGNVYTTNDQYDIDCNCTGSYEDSDQDGTFDGIDPCLDLIYEAEEAFFVGPLERNNQPQFTGLGFVDYVNGTGDVVEFTITAQEAGEYQLAFRYALGASNPRPMELSIDGQVQNTAFDFQPTGDWGNWDTLFLNYTFSPGIHTVSLITNGKNGPNLDHLMLSWCTDCSLSGQPCDDNNPCTVNDVFDAHCNCGGEIIDVDGDFVADACDSFIGNASSFPIETGMVSNVGENWQTIQLERSYQNMVVIATPHLFHKNASPVVSRIRNAGGNSFDLRVQNPGGSTSQTCNVFYIVVEEGIYQEEYDGVKMEAWRVTSEVTAGSGKWGTPFREPRPTQQFYQKPVVLGQVMTQNDADWSVFWASNDNAHSLPPAMNHIAAGKHVGEDTDITREEEVLGMIIIEEGVYEVRNKILEAGLGPDFVRGPNNFGYKYGLSANSAGGAVLSAAAMDGSNGYWPVLFTDQPVSPADITLIVDEDQIKDDERAHTSEQVAFLAFEDQLCVEDEDNDSVCDAEDECPGYNDLEDEDEDGIPDGCDDCDDRLIGKPCDDGNPCTILDVYVANCGCAGILMDSDDDGACNWEDICEGLDDALIGTPCDDSNPNTVNDIYTDYCTCAGVSPDGCTADGQLLYEIWKDINGTQVWKLTDSDQFPYYPDSVGTLDIHFDGLEKYGNIYGSRVSGLLCPPQTGVYSFRIAGDDYAELWLSTDSDPENKELIASVPGWSKKDEWDKYPEQYSMNVVGEIFLIAGKTYYLEALHKEGWGGDHLVVQWEIPDGTIENPMSAAFFSLPEMQLEFIDVQGVSCKGDSDGAATAVPFQGLPPYSFAWDNGHQTALASGLSPGKHEVSVTDATGRTITGLVLIPEPATLSVDMLPQEVSCFNGDDGLLEAQPTGGTAPYQFVWSSGSNDAVAKALTAGTYELTLTDAKGCELILEDIQLGQPSDFDLLATAVPSTGTDGSIDLEVSGATPPYTYEWSTAATTEDLTDLTAGAYQLTVSDAQGCEAETYVDVFPADFCTETVYQAENAYFVGPYVKNNRPNYTGTGFLQFPAEMGDTVLFAIELAESGIHQFQLRYSLKWGNNKKLQLSIDGVVQDTLVFGNTGDWSAFDLKPFYYDLPAGSHSVLFVTLDASSQPWMDALSVCSFQPDPLSGNFEKSHVSCHGENDGALTVIASGGAGELTYQWSTGDTEANIDQLTAGTYMLTITDELGSSIVGSTSISEPEPLTINTLSLPVSCYGGSDGMGYAQPAGGTAPYTYNWSNGSDSMMAFELSAGFWAVTVTDANQCVLIDNQVEVQEPVAISASNIRTPSLNSEGSIDLTPSGGMPGYSFSWSNGPVTEDLDGLSPGDYTVTITDANNCQYEETMTIFPPPAMERGILPAVSGSWKTVSLENTYTSPVVIATVVMPEAADKNTKAPPVVTRIRNLAGNSFDVRVQMAASGSISSSYELQYWVVEEGVYQQEDHGIQLEAVKVLSVETAGKDNWVVEARSYQNTYENPVVVGQVLSNNDPAWSTFWASRANGGWAPPNGSSISAGKHIGEDPLVSRQDETIGYIVVESGQYSLPHLTLEAGLTPDVVEGIGSNNEGTLQALVLSNPGSAVLSAAGMDGNDGGWPVLYGEGISASGDLRLLYDEDIANDNDGYHTTEEVAYVAFDGVPTALRGNLPKTSPKTSQKFEMTIFPNPVVDELSVQTNRLPAGSYSLRITDVNGQIVRSSIIINEMEARLNLTLDAGDLSPGMYFVTLYSEEEKVSESFIKINP
jgi:hypothetical protein